MAENGADLRKLVVEVCNAKNLMPKDGQGTASAYAIVDFDGQRKRTTTKFRDLNPQWDEKLEFVVHDKVTMGSEILEVNLYNDKRTGKQGTFLGKVKISGSGFVQTGSESVVYYPLEKRSVFSQIKGELGLKVYYIDQDPPPPPAASEGIEKADQAAPLPPAAAEKPPEDPKENKKEESNSDDKKVEEKKEDEKKTEEDLLPSLPAPAETKKQADVSAAETAKVSPAAAAVVTNSLAQANKPEQQPSKETEGEQQIQKLGTVVDDIEELRSLSNDRSRSTYDLVDCMPFLYVRVVKVKQGANSEKAGLPVYAKLGIGTHSIKTKTHIDKDWDQVFALDKERLNSTSLEVSIWVEEKKDDQTSEISLGFVSFDLQQVPKRIPPDSPLAPQWYTLESESSPRNDVMLAIWKGTQADEAFQEAWQSDSGGLIPETRAKVYFSPKLWYLRLTVIQTQDLQLGSGTESKVKNPELHVKAQLGSQVFKTARTSVGSGSSGSAYPSWNQDLVFVAAEPFEPFLAITVEDVANSQTVGQTKIHVSSIEKRTDDRTNPKSRWFNLVSNEGQIYTGRIHVKVCLEGGYHVQDEVAHVTSDVRAVAKELAKPAIGLLEVGIRGANNLLPVKTRDGTRGTIDAYVVAKYGPKWVRTRTILDRFNPRWNEQYAWDVYDPCTVITMGVFDNGRYNNNNHDEAGKSKRDLRIGKIRIRLSTLDINRVYLNSYSLSVLLPGGAKKMGEIQIAIRFSCSSWLSLVHAYMTPILPRMHYVRPLGPAQQDILRHTAMRIVTTRLTRSEPPLGHEVVQFMLDSDTYLWSMRRSKANWFRVVGCLSRVATVAGWLDGIRIWSHPPTTLMVHVLLVAVLLCSHLVLPTLFLYAFLILVLRFRYRQRVPLNMDPRLSYIDFVSVDELDEEFDGFPTTRSKDQLSIRYDRLRALAGRAQILLGDMAAQGERLEALFNWRDPRATGILVVFCLMASLTFYVVPFRIFLLCSGFYYLRHPRFRDDMPSIPVNFFRRLPSLSDLVM